MLFLTGCSALAPLNPIFSGTTLITIYSPSGSTTTNFPDFTWTSPGISVVYQVLGIFTNEISVHEKQILNKSDCIAMWTTSLSGSAGDVDFGKFRKVVNGVLTSTPVDSSTLVNTRTYSWAVWGYDNTMTITHSSGQKTFTVP